MTAAGRSTLAIALKGVLCALVIAATWRGLSTFDGNPYLFLLFDASFIALLVLIVPQPRLYSYTFVAAMLFLAFWMKLMLYLAFGTAFLEPIGAFDGTPQSWDRALTYASMAAIGGCVARGMHLWFARRHDWARPVASFPDDAAPRWYAPLRAPLWGISIVLMLALNALNFHVAFYQTGVNPKLILPLHLNVLAAWLTNIGFALWFACLIHWDYACSRKDLPNTLMAPIVEALVSSISALSRSFYAMHTVPYFLALAENWSRARDALPPRVRAGLVVFWLLAFALSLSAVSWLRIHIYYLGYTPTYITIPGTLSGSAANGARDARTDDTNVESIILRQAAGEVTPGATLANQIRPMVQQVSNLFIARWIGLEGILAVAAHERTSADFLLEALRESPAKGMDSIYQKIARSSYDASEAFTFLTLAGSVAILAYSGSTLVVMMGVALLVLVMAITEIAGSHLTRNPLLMSLAGFAMANVLCQTNFPYLTAVFFLQLWTALVFIWGLQALPWRTVRVSTARHR